MSDRFEAGMSDIDRSSDDMLNTARAVLETLQMLRGRRSVRTPTPPNARQVALAAAIEPVGRAAWRLSDSVVVARLAAALPPDAMWKNERGGTKWNGHDDDLNTVMAPIRFRGIYAAQRAGAAHQIDYCSNALWNWQVDDPTWEAALDAIDVAMAAGALKSEGLPVTTGMVETHRQVLEIATEQAACRA